jgi:hypothetical protein
LRANHTSSTTFRFAGLSAFLRWWHRDIGAGLSGMKHSVCVWLSFEFCVSLCVD